MPNIDDTVYNFDESYDRCDSDSVKWNYYPEDVLPMWVADMDFVSPQPVLNALHERINQGFFGYLDSDCASSVNLRQTIIERMAKDHNWAIEPDDILFIPGVVTGFHQTCHALVNDDEAVLVQTPVYHPILHAAKTTGILGQEMQLTRQADGAYLVDWDLFDESIDAQTKLFILCNPHNPVGKVFTQRELERTAEICLREDIVICSDEIHCDLVYDEHPHIPIASIDPEVAQRTITLIAPSKTYNIPGLKFSLAIIQNESLRRRFQQASKGLVSSANLMGLTAALAAYRDGGGWLEQVLVYLQNNLDYLIHEVNETLPGIQMRRPEGTYLAWLDCRQAGIEGSPGEFFLEKGRVAFNAGEMFGNGGEGYVRLNFGCPRSTLKDGLKRVRQALDAL
jgi:cystathionine beta-lyase